MTLVVLAVGLLLQAAGLVDAALLLRRSWGTGVLRRLRVPVAAVLVGAPLFIIASGWGLWPIAVLSLLNAYTLAVWLSRRYWRLPGREAPGFEARDV